MRLWNVPAFPNYYEVIGPTAPPPSGMTALEREAWDLFGEVPRRASTQPRYRVTGDTLADLVRQITLMQELGGMGENPSADLDHRIACPRSCRRHHRYRSRYDGYFSDGRTIEDSVRVEI